MGTLTVAVKWQKELFANVEIDLQQPPLVFKTQLYTLTGVPPERQKIMVKGGLLKDDADWSQLGIKQGQKLMMMGTGEKIPEAPQKALVFVEDLPEDEQDTLGFSKYGAGLQNLGNTCYMNSTLQCLYAVPELRNTLKEYPETAQFNTDLNHRLTVAAKKLFEAMERSAQPVAPFPFLLALREKYPQFAEQAQGGLYKQQDAEECYSQLLWTLKETLKLQEAEEQATRASAIEKLFGIMLQTNLKCEESGEEIQEESLVYALKCNISIDVNHLNQGLELGLRDDREKTSEQLNQMVLFKGASKISALPPYLTIQLVRFFYKVDVQQKAKILRKVAFPLELDVYELCTDELKKQLDGPRSAYHEYLNSEVHKRQKTTAATAEQTSTSGDTDMKDANDDVPKDVLKTHAGQKTGRYDLVAVLTHKGRSADSGHYVAWVKEDDGEWIQFDDEELIPRKADELASLSGGGDWHMGYVLLYKAQTVPEKL